LKKLVSIIVPLIVLAIVNAEGAGDYGTAVEDWSLTKEINSKIRSDPLLKGCEISVDTRQKTVTLSGSADTKDARDRAAQLAKSTNGVKRVYNLIIVSK
jgi:hyperosmotically inducible periplasmic protein